MKRNAAWLLVVGLVLIAFVCLFNMATPIYGIGMGEQFHSLPNLPILAASKWLSEPFSADVFAGGEWTRSDTSVAVDTANGWLHIGADATNDDYAAKVVSFTLPIVVETRMRLVSGGRGYRLPIFYLVYGSTVNDAVVINYNPDMGWVFNIWGNWTYVHVKAPPSENVWMTVLAVLRPDGGELYAKYDGEPTFTFVTASAWTIPNQIVKVQYNQPWDAVCDVDYVAVSNQDPYTILGQVRDNHGNPLAGATLSASGGVTTTTNASGYYTFTNLITGMYTLMPAKAGCFFTPPTRTVSVPSAMAGQDFTGTLQFEDIGALLPSNDYGSAAWGDYDNDGDLDILLSSPYSDYQAIYRNTGGAFDDVYIGADGLDDGCAIWGDYDNDDDLDILMAGWDGQAAARIYRNNGGSSFTDINAALDGVWHSAIAWGDYDNDGDPDVLLAGQDRNNDFIVRLYRNDKGVFTDTGAAFPQAAYASIAWGDYDNDGDLDILLSGNSSSTKVLRNDGGVFADIGAGLAGVLHGSAAWGDYDNDGDLDILLTGQGNGPNLSRVYRNDGGGVFTDIAAGLMGISNGSAVWGDYDNDGDLDILLAGNGTALVYRNDGGVFADIGAGLIGIEFGAAAWGDYDNDGDLDILLSGNQTRIYRNNTPQANTPPTAPSGLSLSAGTWPIVLQWDAASDAQTQPDGLTYNVRVGATPGGSEIVSPMAITNTGYRKLPALGNAGHGPTAALGPLPTGTYYWSVQAIDPAFAGSAFAPEASFQVWTIYLPAILKGWPPLPPAPVLSPIDNADGDHAYTVSWSSVSGADSYVLEQAIRSDFAGASQICTPAVTYCALSGRGPARYYYRVKAHNGWGYGGWSNVQFVDVLYELEPNDDALAQANGPIVSGLTYYGAFPSAADIKDYFYFDLPVAHTVELWLTDIPAGSDYDLVLRDASLLQKGYSGQPGNADEHIPPIALPPGRYYVQIYNRGETGNNQFYHLRGVYQ